MHIKITDVAEIDIENGCHYYEKQCQGLGDYFLDSIYSDIDSLTFFAGIHCIVYGYHRLLCKRFPFAVYYKIDKEFAIVQAVLDCRQNPSWIRRKLKMNNSFSEK